MPSVLKKKELEKQVSERLQRALAKRRGDLMLEHEQNKTPGTLVFSRVTISQTDSPMGMTYVAEQFVGVATEEITPELAAQIEAGPVRGITTGKLSLREAVNPLLFR